jgi:hypothetical protein
MMQKQLSEKSRSSNSDQEFFFNLILKIEVSGMPNADLKMAVILWEYASILYINQKL